MARSRLWLVGRWAAPILLLLFASLAQFHQLGRDARFLPDEAFFMTFARAAAVNGAWLLPGPLDKSPLSMYFSALSLVAVGVTADSDGVLHLDPAVGEFAGKLPNAFLTIALTALMMRLAARVWGGAWAAGFAGLLTAASPYLLAYGPSAFTDISLLFWAALALYFALAGRGGLAGAALGLAFWGKQQAALFAPLVVLVLWARGAQPREWRRFGLALALAAVSLLAWDGARPEASVFLQAAVNNAPASWLAPPSLWPERLANWLEPGAWLLGPPLTTGVLLLAASLLSALQGLSEARPWARDSAPIPRPLAPTRREGENTRGKAPFQLLPLHGGGLWVGGLRANGVTTGRGTRSVERALLFYIVAFLVSHVAIPLNQYDRYLLLILPPLILLTAGQLARLPGGLRIALAALILAGGLWSLHAGSIIGGNRGAYDGVDALAAHLMAKPVAAVVYDPWLGWELDYYLGQWHDKRRVYYPTAEALAAGALELDEDGDRYFVAPIDQAHEEWLAALRQAGFEVAVDYQRDHFLVWRLKPPRN